MNLPFFEPLYKAVAWLVATIHSGLAHFTTASWTWGASIILLTMLMRLLLFPLFMKQFKSQREMQLLQPKLAELKKKYPDDRARQSQEQMQLFKDHGVNPLAGCLPLLVQMPIFFALFGVLHKFTIAADGAYHGYAGLSAQTVQDVASSKIFGVPIAAAFTSSAHTLKVLNANPQTVKTVTVIMILLMMATSFLTARQMMARSKKQGAPMEGAQATTQKIMVYGMPLFFGVIGFNFQMGVLLYWLTTNVWTFGQQYFVIKAMGDDPEAVVKERKAKEATAASLDGKKPATTTVVAAKGKSANTKSANGAEPLVPASTNGTPRPGSPANRKPGQAGSRPANRKRKGGRH